jgi:hypothetical protein
LDNGLEQKMSRQGAETGQQNKRYFGYTHLVLSLGSSKSWQGNSDWSAVSLVPSLAAEYQLF